MKGWQKPVSTNIITGFLGVGKSTAILHLLGQKPAQESWAILVNEFGEIGVDGGLLAQSGQQDVVIKEIPGGCMCCASGLPMQISLNLLLARKRPDRLLIEPTGLGHPAEVLATLSGEQYRGVLTLEQTLTLVDARKVHDERYRKHEIFNQQLEVADQIIANKADLYASGDVQALDDFLAQQHITAPRHRVSHGQIPLDWLKGKAGYSHLALTNAVGGVGEELAGLVAPESGLIRRQGQGEGFASCGWIFARHSRFEFNGLMSLLLGLDMERLKGILHTDQGWFVFNLADGVMSTGSIEDAPDSRLECISIALPLPQWDVLEQALVRLLVD